MTDPSAWSLWPAPAKLNLFLHVLARRSDGYHELQTVFQLLDRGDEIALRARADGAIVRVRGSEDIAAEDDLAVRAAHALRAASDSTLGADIEVRKAIPVGGGLGGGSSDAATVLVALDRIWGTKLGTEGLVQLALALGADVPLFVRGRSAWAEGIGERLQPLELPERWFVVLDARARVSTAAVFQAPELTRNSAATTIPRFLAGEATRNDLEPVVRSRFPGVAAALDWLGAQAPARLTGSGGCVFSAFAERAEAERIANACPGQWSAFVARGVNESPLAVAAQRWPGAG